MTQHDLNRAVARATGETIQEISRRGFVPLTARPSEPDGPCRVLPWEHAPERLVDIPSAKRGEPASTF